MSAPDIPESATGAGNVAGRHDRDPASPQSQCIDMAWDTSALGTDLQYDPCADASWESILHRLVEEDNPSKPDISARSATEPLLDFEIGSQLSTQALLDMLPPTHCCGYLITLYFGRLSPLFHILHGPTFQRQFYEFLKAPSRVDLSWLALLFSVCSIAAHTLEEDDPILMEWWREVPRTRRNGIADSASRFRAAAMICLSQDNFLYQHRMSTLEALLVLIYTINHYEGVERGWTLLGIACNIGIALKCNVMESSTALQAGLNCIDMERRRRCWAGILMLQTYQAMSYRDVDMSFLLNLPATMPADVNDSDISEIAIRPPSSRPTQMSVMMFKIRLFRLSSRILGRASGLLDEATLTALDLEIATEQEQWRSVFLSDGLPSVLDTSSYAYWCILQLHAHQLYLILHRPFCQSRNSLHFRPDSFRRCLSSGTALLDLHEQFLKLPRLRQYRWYVFGMTSLAAVHGAMALASCLLEGMNLNHDSINYHSIFDSGVLRIQSLQDRSQICFKSMPILLHLLSRLSRGTQLKNIDDDNFGHIFDDWVDRAQWLNPERVDWEFWNNMLHTTKA
ncbi:hypothetical protein N7449_010565 [Penicillium cf. viridicatum]|uniref:Xylanolytic transcriptional activator regulatory domain-containing protein n=1 Tax=Penicillium cf. viridicatum TaxID=2972119 RepID=A0A9W9M2U4_9EURO|nr:hypothetical protein N7449_010565 [Penicillium cf. viridicatum]